MVCEHLSAVETALLDGAAEVTFRGSAWSENCREWVYVDRYLDTAAIRARFALAPCVEDHTHIGTHDGSEHGLVCAQHHDAVMGLLEPSAGVTVFP